MHRAFISERDYESYETTERAAQRRQDDREVHMAAHAYDGRVTPQGNRGELLPEQVTFPTDMHRELGPNEAAMLAGKYRKHAPPVMDVTELSEGPNLPHRDDKGVSARSRSAATRAGYYQTGTDAFSSDAYDGKPDPMQRKANIRRIYRKSGDEAYILPVGLPPVYNRDTETGKQPHEAIRWGKPISASNKHLAYWRDPTARDALANVADNRPVQEPDPRDYFTLDIPREFLVMLAKVSDIQAQRGKLENNGQGDALRKIAEHVPAGATVTVDLYSPSDVLAMTRDLPKRYRNGQFGQFMKDIATHVKLAKR